jgi:calcineurin-like phosphoesterase family protein
MQGRGDAILRLGAHPVNGGTIRRAVGPDDTVISVGDFARDGKDRQRWLGALNGNKILIRGNHDCGGPEAGGEHLVMDYRQHRFFIIHNPDHVPENWNGWTIHGHHHWRKPDYPFIDGRWKTINVACELINYTPVDMDRILSLDIDTISTTTDAEPFANCDVCNHHRRRAGHDAFN